MFTVKKSVLINKPRKDVFAFINSPLYIPKWRPDVVNIIWKGKKLKEGDVFEEEVKNFGRFTMKVVSQKENALDIFEAVSGPSIRPAQSFLLQDKGKQTLLDFNVTLETSGFFSLLEPLLKIMIGKKWDFYLKNLKNHLESG